jgi:ABC-type transport system substrate-binding protein
MMSPEIEQIGGKIYRAEHIVGYDEYITGKVPYLEGVGVIDEHQLAITLDHEFLPYFFEVGLLLCVPYPIHVLAPGCKVYDDGYGVYIGNADPSVTEPIFTPELLKETILNEETGYNSHPQVVSGPYIMTSYDGVTSHFERNPYFKGAWFHNSLPGGDADASYIPMLDENNEQRVDAQGNPMYLVIPQIEKICFTLADYDLRENEDGSLYVGENSSIHKITTNEVHIVNKVVNGTAIMDGMNLVGQNMGVPQPYPRIGLSFLTFTYDWPTVHEKEVRQAIAWCMDRDALTRAYCGENGFRVDGYYGIEQWEYRLLMDKPQEQLEDPINLDHEDDLHVNADYKDANEDLWDTLSLENLTEYKVDTQKANALLDSAGWTLNREGGAYRPGTDDVRCKMIDGTLVALDLSLMYPAGNHIVDTMQENFIDNLNECGILLTLVPADMQTLLYYYYREEERVTDMVYLATNFHVIVDPAITYSTDDTAGHLMWNNTYSDDEELYQRAVNMRRTDPTDVYDYVAKWVAFQERYNEVLPTIPVYGNYYYDFWCDRLHNYDITAHVTWTQAILNASFDVPETNG